MPVPLRRPPSPRSAAVVGALALAATMACSGAPDRRTVRRPPPATREDSSTFKLMESAGEVVIPPHAAAYVAGAVPGAGSVAGAVTTTAVLAPSAPVPAGTFSGVCGPTLPDSSAQQKGQGLGNAVVWLDDVRKGKSIPLEKRLELESDHCLLTPRVQAAVIGSAIDVIGHDEFRQHLQFFAAGENAPRARVLLGKDEQVIPTELVAKVPGLVLVRDADHPWPQAYVAVFDHPYYSVTRPDGSFAIDGVPAGTYTLVAWHERTGRTQQKVTVPAGGTARVAVTVKGK